MTHVTQGSRHRSLDERHNDGSLCQEFGKNIQLSTVSNKLYKRPQKTKTKQRKKVDILHNNNNWIQGTMMRKEINTF